MIHPYASETYAQAFNETCTPIYLEHCGTWILKRQIANTPYFDAMGCYPRCVIKPDANLAADFNFLQNSQLVTLVLVSDIFIHPDISILENAFDYVHPFKVHYLFDPHNAFHLSKHHRYEVKKSLAECTVKIVKLADYLAEWQYLYANLIKRHQINGVQTFSPHYFSSLCNVENLITTAVFFQEKIISMHLWLSYDNFLYSHLAAASELGYQHRSSYANYHFIIETFGADKFIDFGGGAEMQDDPSDGLVHFKKGFANSSRMSYLCGKILDHTTYQALSQMNPLAGKMNYFPAYRTPPIV